jgi:hypothetical protein
MNTLTRGVQKAALGSMTHVSPTAWHWRGRLLVLLSLMALGGCGTNGPTRESTSCDRSGSEEQRRAC